LERPFDVVVIGGGVVGLASARQIALEPGGLRVVVLEKESQLATHQTGRNSGVIHSGLYYVPGSAKALNCRRGRQLLIEYCRERGVAHELCGKVVVAVEETELPALERIHERARQNGVVCERIGAARLRELEPHAAGEAALRVPETGIVDYPAFCAGLAGEIRDRASEVRTRARVTSVRCDGAGVVVESTAGLVAAKVVVNCAGLHSDRVLAMTGARRPARIVPFRGEYFELAPDARHLCRNLIYPVPDPRFPFLGVHLTRTVSGAVECGPNAVLALKREGYRKRDVSLQDVWDYATYGGFWRLVARHGRTGMGELLRSVSKAAFVRALHRLVPEIRAEQLHPAPAGVRAQALAADGSLLDDFLIVRGERAVNVCNAPSPAATASLAIGEHVASHVREILR
jgi:L-2-hydroxyglutarate oxidase